MTDEHVAIDSALVPRLYGAGELGVLSLTAPGAAHPRVHYVGGELFVGLDHARDAAAVTQGEVEAWPAPFPDALAAALPAPEPLPAVVDGAIVVVDEPAAAALLLDPARLSGLALPGDPVVLALSRRCVVIVGADDVDGFVRALDLAEELVDEHAPLISAHPVMPGDGSWQPYPWRERVPALEMRFERVLRLFSVREYERQAPALARPDIHIADPKIEILESGVTTTFAAWPKGTATLLPVVDNVLIADRSGQLSVATLAQFLDAAGDAVVRTGLSPARYFVPGEAPRG